MLRQRGNRGKFLYLAIGSLSNSISLIERSYPGYMTLSWPPGFLEVRRAVAACHFTSTLPIACDISTKPFHRSQAVGISLWLSCFLKRCFAVFAFINELGRFCL